jgi:hypothetical protein
MILNTIAFGEQERESFRDEFQRIFNGVLKGKEIGEFNTSRIGLLSVLVKDIESGRVTEMDALSSGEKNLILTSLLIAKTVSDGGIVLFDEPELHLSSSVCKELLAFLLTNYGTRKGIQFIICTHSPEILTAAFENEECALFHLKTPSNISKVGRRALDEYAIALQKLGISVGEVLLYERTVLVEGNEDIDFLRTGFGELLRKYNIKDRGGRREVEKTAKKLQELEQTGEKVSPIFIILDKDEEITDLVSSAAVRILQWKRRCIDNYLLDIDVMSELLKDDGIVKSAIADSGEAERLLRRLALDQIPEIAAREVYAAYGFLSPALRSEDMEKKTVTEISEAVFTRMNASRTSMLENKPEAWKEEFAIRLEQRIIQLRLLWEPKWMDICDGKRLFKDLQKEGILRISLTSFKHKIIQRMKETQSDSWRLVESQLRELIG